MSVMKFLIVGVAMLACVAHSLPMDKRRDVFEIVVESLNVTLWRENPCEVSRNFNYYIPYPNDTSRYIQCDPWGTGLIKQCVNGTVWNTWALRCDQPENIHNNSFVLPHRVFNCSLSVGSNVCMNGGVCTESLLGGDRCVCKPEFTGPVCESRVDTSDLTHEILNGTFDVHRYKMQLEALNNTVDVSEYVRYKDQLDNVTYKALIQYMSLYKGREVRYDTLINNLVENILEDIYPDAAYLSTFNSSAISVVDLIQLIPNLMSYAKYSLERYQDVFAKYQLVLDHLVDYLNGTESSHPRLREEAEEYADLTAVFMNQTIALMNATGGSMNSSSVLGAYANVSGASQDYFSGLISSGGYSQQLQQQQQQQLHGGEHLSEDQMREYLRVHFNRTLHATNRLYQSLELFQSEVIELVQNGTSDVFSLTLDQSKLNGTQEVRKLLKHITCSSIKIWDSLVNYGFWYVTSLLTTPAHVMAQQQEVLLNNIMQQGGNMTGAGFPPVGGDSPAAIPVVAASPNNTVV